VQSNRAFHRYLMDGVLVTFTNAQGKKETDHAQLIDFSWARRNDFLVVNQFTIKGAKESRRPDLVCFVNGLPLGLIELKNPADQQADVWKAFDQLQTYQAEISDLLVFNEALVVSDGMNARVGSLTASKEWFMPWRTISDENDKSQVEFELEKVVRGFFRPDLFDLRPRANPVGDLCRSSMSLRSILEDVRRMEKKNLAVELLERLLQGKIKAQTRTNLVQEKKYSDRLIEALRKYHKERRTLIRRVRGMPMLDGQPRFIDFPWISAIRRSPLLDRKLAGDRGDDPDGEGHAGGDEAPRGAGPESG
jgi:type I site-specific restriction-modification system R (restriction) subunit